MALSQGGTADCMSLSFTNDLIRFKVTNVVPIHICHREVQTRIHLKYRYDYFLQHRVKEWNGNKIEMTEEANTRCAFCAKQAQGRLWGVWSFAIECIHLVDVNDWTGCLLCAETEVSQDFQGSANRALHGLLASFLCCPEGRTWSLCTWTHLKAEKLDVLATEYVAGLISH